jgi:class 3 adenylate cyclase/pimeloyl-ACP methyl ester carboxylesterase
LEREVRYCTTSDGVRIAYCVEGQGPPLVVGAIFLESFAADTTVVSLGEFMQGLAKRFQLIRYDSRGSGLSQRQVEDVSPAAYARDIEAVMAAAGFDRVSVLGLVTSSLRCIRFAAEHPDQVAGLVLFNGYTRLLDIFPSEETRDGFLQLIKANWEVGAYTIADLGGRQYGDSRLQISNAYQSSTSGEYAARLLVEYRDVDETELLREIRCPTLVIQNIGYFPASPDLGQRLAAEIPDARLVSLDPDDNPLKQGGHAKTIPLISDFLLRDDSNSKVAREAPLGQSPFRTVLFTDLVGHTEMMRRLGDERGRDVLREHERTTREVLKSHGGIEVKTMGDGFMASFGSVTKAVECAVALQRAFAERNESSSEPLNVRVGLNAGEPIEEEGDLFGSTVILAARIAAAAAGGEVLASMAVRELCSGKGFLFADRGEFVAKGFEEPVRMFEVSWRG